MGGARIVGPCSRALRRCHRCVRRLRDEHVSREQPVDPSRPARSSRLVPAAPHGERQRLLDDRCVVSPRPARPERQRADRVFDIAGRRASRGAELAQHGKRHGARRRRHHRGAARRRLPVPRRRDPRARRPLPRVRRRVGGHGAHERCRRRRVAPPRPTRCATAIRFSPIVRGTAVNNDGHRKVGYLAPSVDGHADVVREALAVAGISSDSITLVEAHGTGTAVGDPIEFAALTAAFASEQRAPCWLGSIKPNIGHLDTGAGVASLIKVVQALRHQYKPPLANFTAPSPLIDVANSPFVVVGTRRAVDERGAATRRYLVARRRRHQRARHRRRSAGAGAAATRACAVQPLMLSARSEAALDRAAARSRRPSRTPSRHRPRRRRVHARHRSTRARTAPRRRAALARRGDRVVAHRRSQAQRRPIERPTTAPRVVFLFPGRRLAVRRHGEPTRRALHHVPRDASRRHRSRAALRRHRSRGVAVAGRRPRRVARSRSRRWPRCSSPRSRSLGNGWRSASSPTPSSGTASANTSPRCSPACSRSRTRCGSSSPAPG